jgi:hypothetical protein
LSSTADAPSAAPTCSKPLAAVPSVSQPPAAKRIRRCKNLSSSGVIVTSFK